MPQHVIVKPELVRWAIERSQLSKGELTERFPKLAEWSTGAVAPTVRQLEDFASRTRTPLGYFFLDAPPDERLPVPDFRTVGDTPIGRPSPDLLETIQAMQRRQAWMRDFAIEDGQPPLEFVGSARNARNVISLAARIRETLILSADWAEVLSGWEDALRVLRKAAEKIGVLVATSGIVGLNTHRALDPQEFRGFVLCDEFAPLIFVNGADSKSAQMFTLAHELVHIWIGRDGLFNLIRMLSHDDETERFCNQVAAEFLVPGHKLSSRWEEASKTASPFQTIARWFKVSPLVAARRALDLRLINKAQFFVFYEKDQEEWRKRKAEEKKTKKGGPDFYTVQDVRLGRRFAYAVVRAAREGRLPYREAYQLTDLKGDTFEHYAAVLTQRIKDERW